MVEGNAPTEFPCTLTIDVPFPTSRLATIAYRALQVDPELSPLVKRDFTLSKPADSSLPNGTATAAAPPSAPTDQDVDDRTVMRTTYSATTNRMLRVAVNGFMESLGVVLSVMEGLDVDVLAAAQSGL